MAGNEAPTTWARWAWDVAGTLLTALLVFGATPTVLVIVVGDPLGNGLGHQWGQPIRIILAVVALVAWVAWVACCTQLTRAVVEQVRRGHVTAPTSGALLTERMAARIAAGVLSIIALATPLVVSAGAGASSGRSGGATTGLGGGTLVPSVTLPVRVAPMDPTVPSAHLGLITYVVQPGDSLWSIASTHLGGGDDWPAIAALNLGRTMPGGLRFVDPSQILAGWTLDLPDEAVSPEPGADAVRRTTTPARPVTAAAPVPAVIPTDSRVERTPGPGSPSAIDPGASMAVARPSAAVEAGLTHPNLPELAALGIGALACAALVRRSRRTRLLRQLTTAVPGSEPPPSAGAIDTDILLSRFAGLPALRAFEAANYALATVTAQARHPGDAAKIRAICVGAAGVDFWLAQPDTPAPDGFTLTANGSIWRAPHDAFPRPAAGRPFLPVVLPVGEDEAGTWLVPVEAGCCLPLVGESAAALWRAARAAQEAWTWADLVLITDDPLVIAREVQLQGVAEGGHVEDPLVLFCGDPASLPNSLADKVAIVTVSHGPASDVTILVDPRAASIHPLGRTVRPHLMAETTARFVSELLAAPAAEDTRVVGSPATNGLVDDAPLVPPTGDTWAHDARSAPAMGHGRVAPSIPDPGFIEVRLLTATPRIDGLDSPLPPNRARRAVELVAYLALHSGDDVTSDRLRTRVLGSAEVDAASKTLFNIAAAARRAMGTDPSGLPLFPPGTRTGHYRVAEGVITDVQRAAALAREGSATADPETAMGLLRAALALVEGEPMANVLAGYDWWRAEGHDGRIAAVLVNAASDLAALAVDAGFFELAQWGLDQARLVEPYSEALSRTAMQVAAAAGDADRLRREWHDCQRRIDELDPGRAPSLRTERLYGELTERVLVGVTPTAEPS
jgi:DNA-binding SARP family transcriptional activator